MKLQEFIYLFEEIVMVESGTVSMDTELSELADWDSLAQIALLSVFEEKLGIKMGVASLIDVKKFSEIVDLINEHLE
ncbi:MAG: phosphopantetheine-binding protein [Candidatus Pristimantibacillus sp.]